MDLFLNHHFGDHIIFKVFNTTLENPCLGLHDIAQDYPIPTYLLSILSWKVKPLTPSFLGKSAIEMLV